MFSYQGPADCVLEDGTSLPVSVSLRSESGLLDGITGTATSDGFPLPLLNAAEVTLRLADGRRRLFLIKNVVGTSGLELVSNGAGFQEKASSSWRAWLAR
jgi:hypothetical protein